MTSADLCTFEVCTMQRYADVHQRTKHTQWSHSLLLSQTHTQTHTEQLPGDAESVSKDKAISRSEYRQTEGIVLREDTQRTTSTASNMHRDDTDDGNGQEGRNEQTKGICATWSHRKRTGQTRLGQKVLKTKVF